VYALPFVPAGGESAVKAGATPTMMVNVGVTALGRTPFDAVTWNVYVPFTVGVPDRTPVAAFNVSPVGNVPDDTVNMIDAEPVAVNV